MNDTSRATDERSTVQARINVRVDVTVLDGHDSERFPIEAIRLALENGLHKFKIDAEDHRSIKGCEGSAGLAPEPVAHSDPTGTAREPPHCPTCGCGLSGEPDGRPMQSTTPVFSDIEREAIQRLIYFVQNAEPGGVATFTWEQANALLAHKGFAFDPDGNYPPTDVVALQLLGHVAMEMQLGGISEETITAIELHLRRQPVPNGCDACALSTPINAEGKHYWAVNQGNSVRFQKCSALTKGENHGT